MTTSTERMRRLRERRAAALIPVDGPPPLAEEDRLAPAVEESIAALNLGGEHAAAAQLARRYAEVIGQAENPAYALRWVGPLLLSSLEALQAWRGCVRIWPCSPLAGRRGGRFTRSSGGRRVTHTRAPASGPAGRRGCCPRGWMTSLRRAGSCERAAVTLVSPLAVAQLGRRAGFCASFTRPAGLVAAGR
jgi:hypothetical protein